METRYSQTLVAIGAGGVRIAASRFRDPAQFGLFGQGEEE